MRFRFRENPDIDSHAERVRPKVIRVCVCSTNFQTRFSRKQSPERENFVLSFHFCLHDINSTILKPYTDIHKVTSNNWNVITAIVTSNLYPSLSFTIYLLQRPAKNKSVITEEIQENPTLD